MESRAVRNGNYPLLEVGIGSVGMEGQIRIVGFKVE